MSPKSTQPLTRRQCVCVLAALLAVAVATIMLLSLVGCRSSSVYPIPVFVDPVTHEAPHVTPDH